MKFQLLAAAILAGLTGLAAADELKVDILEAPPADCTRKTQKGDNVIMQYKGMLTDGTMFDQSYGRAPYVQKLSCYFHRDLFRRKEIKRTNG